VISFLRCFPVLLLFALPVWTFAGEGPPPKPEVDLPFPVGERLEYALFWGWIGVGTSVAETRWELKEDRWYIVIQFQTRTNHVLRRLYPVDDHVETWVDAETLRPLHFTTKLQAGRHFRHERTTFDWDQYKAFYERFHEDGRVETSQYTIQETTRDLVSFMYFMRGKDFPPGEVFHFEVIVNDKLYDLEVHTRDVERVNLRDFGRVESLRIDPRASFEGVFVRRGEMSVWLSRDPRRILTKLEVDTPFASVRILLRDVSGPGDDFWVSERD
jgi:hypothetical protein